MPPSLLFLLFANPVATVVVVVAIVVVAAAAIVARITETVTALIPVESFLWDVSFIGDKDLSVYQSNENQSKRIKSVLKLVTKYRTDLSGQSDRSVWSGRVGQLMMMMMMMMMIDVIRPLLCTW